MEATCIRTHTYTCTHTYTQEYVHRNTFTITVSVFIFLFQKNKNLLTCMLQFILLASSGSSYLGAGVGLKIASTLKMEPSAFFSNTVFRTPFQVIISKRLKNSLAFAFQSYCSSGTYMLMNVYESL